RSRSAARFRPPRRTRNRTPTLQADLHSTVASWLVRVALLFERIGQPYVLLESQIVPGVHIEKDRVLQVIELAGSVGKVDLHFGVLGARVIQGVVETDRGLGHGQVVAFAEVV